MMINAVPAAKGISDQFAPREIVTGRRLNLKHLKAGLYALGGFVVRTVLMDGEFEKIKPEVELDINISAAREHVGEIERYHRTLKEMCRCVLAGMRPLESDAYQYLHKQIVIWLVYFCVMMIIIINISAAREHMGKIER